jgi:hypothetical protein
MYIVSRIVAVVFQCRFLSFHISFNFNPHHTQTCKEKRRESRSNLVSEWKWKRRYESTIYYSVSLVMYSFNISKECPSLLLSPPPHLSLLAHLCDNCLYHGGATIHIQCCLICHESLSDNLIALRCGHVFHEACDQSWRVASKKNQCSACKQMCRDKDIIRLFYEIAGADAVPAMNELIQASDGGTADLKVAIFPSL